MEWSYALARPNNRSGGGNVVAIDTTTRACSSNHTGSVAGVAGFAVIEGLRCPSPMPRPGPQAAAAAAAAGTPARGQAGRVLRLRRSRFVCRHTRRDGARPGSKTSRLPSSRGRARGWLGRAPPVSPKADSAVVASSCVVSVTSDHLTPALCVRLDHVEKERSSTGRAGT